MNTEETRISSKIFRLRNKVPQPTQPPGILRVKLAVKLLVIAWTLMKKKEMFAYERLNNC